MTYYELLFGKRIRVIPDVRNPMRQNKHTTGINSKFDLSEARQKHNSDEHTAAGQAMQKFHKSSHLIES